MTNPNPDAAADPAYATGLSLMRQHRVGIMVVAYDAETHIASVLRRIPAEVREAAAEVFVLDDCSTDRTADVARAAGAELGMENLKVFRTPSNRGYGGNQKVGYKYAIERGFDFVVMVHGDGQYPPERIPLMLAPMAAGADVVLGSRMINRQNALAGGMPFYKWIGNQVLTAFENFVLGVRLSEFHTGYRAYRVATLNQIPFRYDSDRFHFDTEILIQLISARANLVEIGIPTFYGEETCHVNGLRYALDCGRSVLSYRLFTFGLFYNPLLDFALFETPAYHLKTASNSLHQHVLRRLIAPEDRLLHLGSGRGDLSAELARVCRGVVAADLPPPTQAGAATTVALDLNLNFEDLVGQSSFAKVVALDVIEHVEEPELTVARMARVLPPGGVLIASTANIAYILMRLMLLFGRFSYSKRGILDRGHRRLFTVRSFRRMLETYGFEVDGVRGFGPPIRDLVSDRFPYSVIDSVLGALARVWPGVFAYNFLVTARRLPTLDEIYEATVTGALENHPSEVPETAAPNAGAGPGAGTLGRDR